MYLLLDNKGSDLFILDMICWTWSRSIVNQLIKFVCQSLNVCNYVCWCQWIDLCSWLLPWKLNKWKTIINELPVAGNPILILLGYYISVATAGFLLYDVILLESLDWHSGSNMNSIHTGIIDMYTDLKPANNATNNKLYYCPV